jgi:tellurite resistance protein TerC
MWGGFAAIVSIMLALDLGVFNRKAHEPTFRESLTWSIVWVGIAIAFNAGVYLMLGPQAGIEFATGYVIEKALSVDNIFVFVMLFTYFQVPLMYQHRVLFWGVIGAIIMRGILIAVGAALLAKFHWIIYVFGALLLFTGAKMAFQKNEAKNPEDNPVIRFLRRFIPVTTEHHGQKFFVRQKGADGRLTTFATPLFMVLVLVELSDLVFAVDSVPAIFAVTTDPFIVLSSNVFAILGLRSLFFLLAGIVHKFHLLKLGLSLILVFVGAKMMLLDVFKIPVLASLAVVATILVGSVVLSLVFPKKDAH